MTSTARILVVADGDSEELARDLSHGPCRAIPAPDWREALRYLRGGPFHPANRPNLIVVHLEKVGWRDTLAHFRADPYAAVIPLLVLLDDADPAKVLRAYEDGARAVVVPPEEPRKREERLHGISRFWCEEPSRRPATARWAGNRRCPCPSAWCPSSWRWSGSTRSRGTRPVSWTGCWGRCGPWAPRPTWTPTGT